MEISQILALDDKDEVSEVKGTVTTVYDRNSGKIKGGPRKGKPWTVQNFMLEDEAGDEIKVGAWNMDDLSELEGQTITLKKDMHFKDDGEYQSLEMGKNTKIIEEGASESPTRERKADSGEKSKPTREKTSAPDKPDRNDAIYWQTCLKVAGNVFTGTSEIAAGAKGGLLEFARELFSARPGSPAQNKVRKFVQKHTEKDEERGTGKTVKDPEPEQPDLQDGNDDTGDEPEVEFE